MVLKLNILTSGLIYSLQNVSVKHVGRVSPCPCFSWIFWNLKRHWILSVPACTFQTEASWVVFSFAEKHLQFVSLLVEWLLKTDEVVSNLNNMMINCWFLFVHGLIQFALFNYCNNRDDLNPWGNADAWRVSHSSGHERILLIFLDSDLHCPKNIIISGVQKYIPLWKAPLKLWNWPEIRWVPWFSSLFLT